MDIKKATIPTNTVTRTLSDFDKQTGNIYETVNVIATRANQSSRANSPSSPTSPTIWRRHSKTANRSRYRVSMSVCPSPYS